MRALILAVVSTASQATEDKASLEVQLSDCRAACESHQWQVVGEIVMPGQSRNYRHLHQIVRDSPEFAQLVDLIESRTADVLVCWAWSRIGRTMELTMALGALCDENNVQIYPVKSPTRIVPPEEYKHQSRVDDKLMRGLQGWNSERENVERVARTSAGMRGRIARGLHGSASRPPYGYRDVGPGRPLDMVPAEAAHVRWVFQRRAERVGIRRIAAEMNDMGWRSRNGHLWRDGTLSRMLRNSYYAGIVHWGGYSANGQHDPIIDRDLWERVQTVNREQSLVIRSDRIHPLSGLAACAFCGWSMTHTRRMYKGTEYRSLRCSKYTSSGRRECCSNQMATGRAEAVVLSTVMDLLRDPSIYDTWVSARHDTDDASRLTEIGELVDTHAREAERLLAVYLSGSVTQEQFETNNGRLREQIAQLEAERLRIWSWRETAATTARQIAALAPLAGELEYLPPEDLNTIYRQIIHRVLVSHGSLEILWRG